MEYNDSRCNVDDNSSPSGSLACLHLLGRSSVKHDSSHRSVRQIMEYLKNSGVKPRRGTERRSSIPPRLNKSASFISAIRSCIGKDLTSVSMPVTHSEPLTVLQRLTEDLQYSNLLDLASRSKDNVEELAYVAAFSVSAYSNTMHRDGKPFNPLLGETFECDRIEDKGWRSIAEQVLMNPPTAAMHCESQDWTLWMNIALISKYKGKNLEVQPLGTVHVKFNSSNRHYSWKKVNTNVHNLLMGKIWFEHVGDVSIVERSDGYKCHLSFKPHSFFARYTRQVIGVITDPNGQEVYHLSGTWDHLMEGKAAEAAKSVLLWSCEAAPKDSGLMYNFSKLAIELNELEEDVAPTDSRLRPDMRLMEIGEWELASDLKQRLEGRRSSVISSSNRPPMWFTTETDAYTGETNFVFNGDYWQCKASRNWTRCPSPFLS